MRQSSVDQCLADRSDQGKRLRTFTAESFENRLLVRFRVDGVLREALQRRALGPLLVSRVKVMAHLDIAEKRLPQDGRISLKGGRAAGGCASLNPASRTWRAGGVAVAGQARGPIGLAASGDGTGR